MRDYRQVESIGSDNRLDVVSRKPRMILGLILGMTQKEKKLLPISRGKYRRVILGEEVMFSLQHAKFVMMMEIRVESFGQ